MRCFYVLKKRSPAKLSLNRDLSLDKVSLNQDCTVLRNQSVYYINLSKIMVTSDPTELCFSDICQDIVTFIVKVSKFGN